MYIISHEYVYNIRVCGCKEVFIMQHSTAAVLQCAYITNTLNVHEYYKLYYNIVLLYYSSVGGKRMGQRVIVVGGYWKLSFYSRAEAETACKLFKRPPPSLLTSPELQRNLVTAAERYPRGCFWHLYKQYTLSQNCLNGYISSSTIHSMFMYPSRVPTNKNDAAQKNIHRTGIIIDYYTILNTTSENMILCFTNYTN